MLSIHNTLLLLLLSVLRPYRALQFGHFRLHNIVRFLARRACAEGVKDSSLG